jgi:hypothetical protein
VAAARAVLGAVANVAHEALLLSAEIVEPAPLSGLVSAAKTPLKIRDAMQDVDVRRLVHALDQPTDGHASR